MKEEEYSQKALSMAERIEALTKSEGNEKIIKATQSIPSDFKRHIDNYHATNEIEKFNFGNISVAIYDDKTSRFPTSGIVKLKHIYINLDHLSDVPSIFFMSETNEYIEAYYAFLHELSHMSDTESVIMPDNWNEYINSTQEIRAAENADNWLRQFTEQKTLFDINSYDYYIVAFSGGKDSMACFLHLLDIGIPKSKIELWHHLVDGKEGSTLMDWPVTEDYCRKVAKAFDVPIYFSWKEGGFEREMTRKDQPTAPNHWEYPDDNIIECGLSGGRGPSGTRQKFPQVSADLSVRWCSAYLKIDVATSSINNQSRFNGKRTLVISGERAEESPARAKYKTYEPDRADNRKGAKKRLVDHLRPVHAWKEKEVWDIIQKHNVNPHPAYRLGWGRLSCMKCIFGSDNQWATISAIDFSGLMLLVNYEKRFGVTIHRKLSIPERVAKGKQYDTAYRTNGVLEAAMNKTYTLPVFAKIWVLPAGAYGENAGPQ